MQHLLPWNLLECVFGRPSTSSFFDAADVHDPVVEVVGDNLVRLLDEERLVGMHRATGKQSSAALRHKSASSAVVAESMQACVRPDCP
jgi:hypothetical protein